MAVPEGLSEEAMRRQAQHIWTMLDEMSEKDPSAYRAFIDKHIKEETSEESQRLYVNVLGWSPIKAPASDQDPIPVMGGPLYKGKDEQGTYTVVSIGFNPSVLNDFGRDSPLAAERQMLVNLALDFICDQHKLKVSRDYMLLGPDEPCKGPAKQAVNNLTQKTTYQANVDKELKELEKMFGPMAAGCKESLLKEMSNIASDGQESWQSEKSDSEIRIGSDTKVKKEGLIEEVSSSVNSAQTPHYDMHVQEGDDPCIVLKIKLPLVSSVMQCQLDISQNDVFLQVDDIYQLEVELPHSIRENDATAKFSKRSSTLTLMLPV